jgi:hypothetical protein
MHVWSLDVKADEEAPRPFTIHGAMMQAMLRPRGRTRAQPVVLAA